ncbi:hypothetical protein BJV82DRAFT_674957 [Fennellomyces sp. T-0311]|nr:hypothetical protein BJV82DRAFT_674957 [Fennellomyces sp. T-0311]
MSLFTLDVVEKLEKALKIFRKPVESRSLEEKLFVEADPDVLEIASRGTDLVAVTEEAIEAIKGEIAMVEELRELEERKAAELEEERAAIAMKYGRPLNSLAHMKLPFLRANTGRRTGYTQFLSESYTQADRAQLTSDNMQAGNIMKVYANRWRELSTIAREDWQRRANEYNRKMGLDPIRTSATPATRYCQLASCLQHNFTLLKQECDMEAVCFIAARSLEGFQPIADVHGTPGALAFVDEMQWNLQKFTNKTMCRAFSQYCVSLGMEEEKAKETLAAEAAMESVPIAASPAAVASASRRRRRPTPGEATSPKKEKEAKICELMRTRYAAAMRQAYPDKEFTKTNFRWKSLDPRITVENWPQGIPFNTPSSWKGREKDTKYRETVFDDLIAERIRFVVQEQ